MTLYDTCVLPSTTNGSVESVTGMCDCKRCNSYSINTGASRKYTSYSSNNSPDAHCSNEVKEICNDIFPWSLDSSECTVVGPICVVNDKGSSP